MKAIGGYPALELNSGKEYHSEAIALNTSRNALEYILKAKKISKVYLPDYTCEAVIEPFEKCKVDYSFYPIGLDLEPRWLPELEVSEAILYTNYFGIRTETVHKLHEKYGRSLIVDNAQAFYENAIVGIDTIYSPRKFFGVSDGGYLYTDTLLSESLETDESFARILPQLKRYELGAEAGYQDFRNSEENLCNAPIKRMSVLTRGLLSSIDYVDAAEIRRRNYSLLNDALSVFNLLDATLPEGGVPLAYPFLIDCDIKAELIKNKIFVPTYWPNVLESAPATSDAYRLARHLLPLPIDQHCGPEEMARIISVIKTTIA